ncbi:MAG: RHS repeat protein, partial [Bdellovibrionaceae bacterium]|nr:RHS repeat protein [Pseudobdellovibrionaceae bacterium]
MMNRLIFFFIYFALISSFGAQAIPLLRQSPENDIDRLVKAALPFGKPASDAASRGPGVFYGQGCYVSGDNGFGGKQYHCDLYDIPVGVTGQVTVLHVGIVSTETVELGPAVLTDTEPAREDFAIISDTCSDQLFEGGTSNNSCTMSFSFTPSKTGVQNGYVKIPSTNCIDNNGTPFCLQGEVIVTLFGKGIDFCPKCESSASGSLIRIDSQSVIERIPIVGTDFDLVYSSQYSPDYVDARYSSTRRNAFNTHGVTVSAQHFYFGRLLSGSGIPVVANSKSDSGNSLVVSSDGSEVYEFSSTGIHLRTKSALTGATKLTFNYNGSNKLTSIVDAFGNTTTFSRDGSGKLTQITAPYGQVTDVTINSAGLVTAIENPNGEVYSLTYKTGTELVETFTKPGGQTTTFTYDSDGRLIKDLGHGGDYSELSQNLSLPGKPITLTSKLGRQKVMESVINPTGQYDRTLTMPDGNVKIYTEQRNGSMVDEDNQRKITTTTVPDERFGTAFDRLSTSALRMGGVSKTTSYGQTVAYGSGITPDFFNFDSITSTKTVSGRVETTVYNAATKTFTRTSDEGA